MYRAQAIASKPGQVVVRHVQGLCDCQQAGPFRSSTRGSTFAHVLYTVGAAGPAAAAAAAPCVPAVCTGTAAKAPPCGALPLQPPRHAAAAADPRGAAAGVGRHAFAPKAGQATSAPAGHMRKAPSAGAGCVRPLVRRRCRAALPTWRCTEECCHSPLQPNGYRHTIVAPARQHHCCCCCCRSSTPDIEAGSPTWRPEGQSRWWQEEDTARHGNQVIKSHETRHQGLQIMKQGIKSYT